VLGNIKESRGYKRREFFNCLDTGTLPLGEDSLVVSATLKKKEERVLGGALTDPSRREFKKSGTFGAVTSCLGPLPFKAEGKNTFLGDG